MAISPKDFANVAQTLGGKSGCTEAELRTAVGRLYYSLYHVSLRRLIAINELDQIPSYDVHSNVIKGVKQIKDNLGYQLDRLRMMRKKADYDLNSSDQDWPKNYGDAKAIAARIGPSLETLARKQN
jgi:uncharacterized protein (UPF0332 family)